MQFLQHFYSYFYVASLTIQMWAAFLPPESYMSESLPPWNRQVYAGMKQTTQLNLLKNCFLKSLEMMRNNLP